MFCRRKKKRSKRKAFDTTKIESYYYVVTMHKSNNQRLYIENHLRLLHRKNKEVHKLYIFIHCRHLKAFEKNVIGNLYLHFKRELLALEHCQTRQSTCFIIMNYYNVHCSSTIVFFRFTFRPEFTPKHIIYIGTLITS